MRVQIQFELKDEEESYHLEKFLDRHYKIGNVKVLPNISENLKADPTFRQLEWKAASAISDMNQYIKYNNS